MRPPDVNNFVMIKQCNLFYTICCCGQPNNRAGNEVNLLTKRKRATGNNLALTVAGASGRLHIFRSEIQYALQSDTLSNNVSYHFIKFVCICIYFLKDNISAFRKQMSTKFLHKNTLAITA
jgi:hypothetical protein